MKFGGLSEDDVQKISDILKTDQVEFSVVTDNEIESFNSASMKNDLRHFNPPNISTHILAIQIQDDQFQNLSLETKEKLLVFGITNQAPPMEDFLSDEVSSTPMEEILRGQKRVVGANLKHQMIIGALIVGLLLTAKYLFKF